MFNLSSTIKWIAILAAVLIVGLAGAYFMYRDALGNKTTEHTTSQIVVQEVRKIGKLELVHYKLKEVLEKRVDNNVLGWTHTSKILLVVSGEAVGCIDLTKLDSAAVQLNDSTLTLRLPKAELCVFKIDHQNSKIYDANFSLVTRLQGKETALIDAAYKEAETQVRDAAIKEGILTETDKQARVFLQPLLQKLGAKHVRFE